METILIIKEWSGYSSETLQYTSSLELHLSLSIVFVWMPTIISICYLYHWIIILYIMIISVLFTIYYLFDWMMLVAINREPVLKQEVLSFIKNLHVFLFLWCKAEITKIKSYSNFHCHTSWRLIKLYLYLLRSPFLFRKPPVDRILKSNLG